MNVNMEITNKTTKQGLIEILRGADVKDTNLKFEVTNTLALIDKDLKLVTKDDLKALATKVVASLSPQLQIVDSNKPLPVEGKSKPKLGKSKPKAVEPDDQDDEEQADEKPKKDSKPKGKDKPKAKVETVPPISNKGIDKLPTAKVFPEEIDHEHLGKIVACTGEYTDYNHVYQAIEQGKTLYFACYWSKRQIKEFDYAGAQGVPSESVKGGFPLDLDILTAVLTCQTIERIYAMSIYSEALFKFEGIDFVPVEDVDPRGDGSKFQIRVSAGMEFEIYRPIDEEVDPYVADDEQDEEYDNEDGQDE